jgi:hypothetical protein
MTTFDDRQNAFEAKFAHDAEMQFKAEARRNKLAGSGPRAPGQSGDEAAAYAASGQRRLPGGGRRGRVRKLAGGPRGRADDAAIRAADAGLLAEAQSQLMNEAR